MFNHVAFAKTFGTAVVTVSALYIFGSASIVFAFGIADSSVFLS